ncbi:MAG TPA: tetratricopeptide repeat protein, partial [Myxococcaceae bacterium]|nr:tetratricopeptide repeat protein [Myxococcaceae bacterium]
LRQQALELCEQQWGPEHINTALMRLFVANSYIDLDQPERALSLVEQVLPLFEKSLDKESPSGALPLLIKGEALQRLGRSDEALPLLEHILHVLERRPERPEYTAEVRFTLAQALWDTGKEEARALRLANAAHGVLSRMPLFYKKELAELEALLKRHAPPSPEPPAPSASMPPP